MVLSVWPAVCIAFVSSSVYLIGIALFKQAARRMPPLHGTQPVRMMAEMLSSTVWLVGAGVIAIGLVLQGIALSVLALPAAQPVFLASLTVLLAISIGCFTERMTGREWLSVAVIAAGTLMVAAAAAGTRPEDASPPSASLLALVAAPSLVVPILVFLICDRQPVGVHARPSTGVALGVTSGVLIGTAELCLDGMARLSYPAGSLPGTPYPYLLVVAAGLGVAQLQTALQRHRMVVIVLAATVAAKTHLLLTGTVLYGLAWPRGAGLALLLGGAAAATVAVLLLPRHERPDPRRVAGSGARVR